MLRSRDQNANGVTQGGVRKISASRKFHESRKIEPTDNPRMANRHLNGNAKHDMLNGQVQKRSTTSLDPHSFVEAATLLGSVGSLKAAETTERVRRGSTSYEEDVYKGHPFPFENLVFEGGGNKGMAYVGALQVFFFNFLGLNFVVLLFVLTCDDHGFLRYRVLISTFLNCFLFTKSLSFRFRGCVIPIFIVSLCLLGTSFLQSKSSLTCVRK